MLFRSNPNGEANIHILGFGELEINGDFDFSGNGFFQFDTFNILTLNANFNLEGMGKNFRFIRLNANADLIISDYSTYLQDGKVEFLSGSEIFLDEGVTGRFADVAFAGEQGQLSATGVNGIGAAYMNFINCSFRYLGSAVSGVNLTGVQVGNGDPNYLQVTYSDFYDCTYGVSADFTPKSVVNYCEFEKMSIGVKLHYIDNGYVSNSDFTDCTYGIFLNEEVPDCNVRLCELIENETGIYVGTLSNVDVHCSVVNDNITGIEVLGSAASGLVTIHNSSLSCNKTGVNGTDVLLNIHNGKNYFSACWDGIIDEQHNYATENHLFNLCFDERAPIGNDLLIDAIYNAWDNGSLCYNNNEPGPEDVPGWFTYFDCTNGIDYTVSDAHPICNGQACATIWEPISPTGDGSDGGDEECEFEFSGVLFDIFTKYATANNSYADEMVEEKSERSASDELFSEIASLPPSIQEVLDELCNFFIKIAQVRTGYQPEEKQVPGFGTPDKGISKDGSYTLVGFPNPTNNTYSIRLPEGIWELSIQDLYGKKLHTETTSFGSEIQVKEWTEGLYFIQAVNTVTAAKLTGKFLIQR